MSSWQLRKISWCDEKNCNLSCEIPWRIDGLAVVERFIGTEYGTEFDKYSVISIIRVAFKINKNTHGFNREDVCKLGGHDSPRDAPFHQIEPRSTSHTCSHCETHSYVWTWPFPIGQHRAPLPLRFQLRDVISTHVVRPPLSVLMILLSNYPLLTSKLNTMYFMR
jgi:hypothetical protein